MCGCRCCRCGCEAAERDEKPQPQANKTFTTPNDILTGAIQLAYQRQPSLWWRILIQSLYRCRRCRCRVHILVRMPTLSLKSAYPWEDATRRWSTPTRELDDAGEDAVERNERLAGLRPEATWLPPGPSGSLGAPKRMAANKTLFFKKTLKITIFNKHVVFLKQNHHFGQLLAKKHMKKYLLRSIPTNWICRVGDCCVSNQIRNPTKTF